VAEESRLDRELIELLNELRVALPGVQVLFAFLLTVPFTGAFQRVTELQKDTYVVALLATALGSALLIAPSAYHRLRFRAHDKEQLLRTANRLAVGGTVFLAIAITASVFLVTDFILSRPAAAVFSGGVAGACIWFWYGLPLLRRARDPKT
jgi:O-antigen/teichoic acid export membrane protein